MAECVVEICVDERLCQSEGLAKFSTKARRDCDCLTLSWVVDANCYESHGSEARRCQDFVDKNKEMDEAAQALAVASDGQHGALWLAPRHVDPICHMSQPRLVVVFFLWLCFFGAKVV